MKISEERIKDRLGDIQSEIEQNTLHVKRMKLKMGQGLKPTTMLVFIVIGLLLWTVFLSWARY